ncbi:MAG: hypothetical protein ACM3PY_18210 [Omnitrophica WOR_2 bacterium]
MGTYVRRFFSFVLLLGMLLLSGNTARAKQATPSPVSILSPQPGQALQGNVAIIANTAVPDFQSAELSFAYKDNPTKTWFFITQSNQPVTAGQLAEWDTSALTDGDYTLRLVVTKKDGSQLVAAVSGLRVRNYTPVETNTPAPPAPAVTPVAGSMPEPVATATLLPSPSLAPVTPTPLPPNPAQVNSSDMILSILQGVLVVVAVFSVAGLYIAFRQLNRK